MKKLAAFVIAGALALPVAFAAAPQTPAPQQQTQTKARKHHRHSVRKHTKRSSPAVKKS